MKFEKEIKFENMVDSVSGKGAGKYFHFYLAFVNTIRERTAQNFTCPFKGN